MELVLNILALAATAGVAYMCAAQGAYRSGMTLVACVLAGALGFGLFGPIAALLPANDADSVWYYAADAIALWAVFAVAFLGLRTLGETFLPVQPDFAPLPSRIGGGVLGLATGYLSVGMCLVLMQMMPMAPDILGGYSPFHYRQRGQGEASDRINRAGQLWLNWDRGVLAVYEYVLGGPLGPGAGGPCERYGDVYPPREMRAAQGDSPRRAAAPAADRTAGGSLPAVAGSPAVSVAGLPPKAGPPESPPAAEVARRKLPGEGVTDADDFLYYHWYRRYQFIKWRTNHAEGPIPDEAALEARRPGMPIRIGAQAEQHGLWMSIDRIQTLPLLKGFPEIRIDASEQFLMLDVRFRPVARDQPMTVQSASFSLLDRQDHHYRKPMVWGRARRIEGKEEFQPGASNRPAAHLAPEGTPRFVFPARSTVGDFLLDGASFAFTAPEQDDLRHLVFVVPKDMRPDRLRLVYEPAAPK